MTPYWAEELIRTIDRLVEVEPLFQPDGGLSPSCTYCHALYDVTEYEIPHLVSCPWLFFVQHQDYLRDKLLGVRV